MEIRDTSQQRSHGRWPAWARRGAVAAAAAARELRGILMDLAAEQAAKQPERDEIDELRARRTGTSG